MTIRVERRPTEKGPYWWVLLEGRQIVAFADKGSSISVALNLHGALKSVGCELQLPPKGATP